MFYKSILLSVNTEAGARKVRIHHINYIYTSTHDTSHNLINISPVLFPYVIIAAGVDILSNSYVF